MKLGKLMLGAAVLLISTSSFGQDDGEDRECKRMLFLAQQARTVNNDYKESTMYMTKAEQICGGLDAKDTKILIASLRNTINGESDEAVKKLYADSLSGAYSRAEAAGFYDQADDLIRAANELGSSNPDREKANTLFERGIATQGEKTHEGYLSYYYYNLYAMYAAAPADQKSALKSKMIEKYFELSALISKGNMSAQTQETITNYFNAVVNTCADILPELKGFMETLPSDVEMKKAALMNFITLLENKKCTDAAEYGDLINAYVETDPSSLDAQLMKAKYLIAKKKYSDAISTLRTAKGLASDDAKKMEITYMIASAQFSQGSYKAAYGTAMSISGEYKGKALVIAGKSVGNNANNCGASTFERKCNYVYAVQLLQQASGLGESSGGAIGTYKSRYPTESEIFDEGSPASVNLSCYGVSVSPKG